MKSINLIIIVLLTSLNIGFSQKKVQLKVDRLDLVKPSNEKDKVEELFYELKPLLDKPLSWCNVEPTGEFEVIPVNKKVSRLFVQVVIECDEVMAITLFTNIVNRYKNTIRNNPEMVDKIMSQRYPHLNIFWNEEGEFECKVNYNKKYTNRDNYNQKLVMFKMVINEEMKQPNVSMVDFHGNILTNFKDNTRKKTSDKFRFQYEVFTKTLTESNPTIEFERVYEIDEETLTNFTKNM